MSQFKIIAVQPLKGCLKYYRKILEAGKLYFLYKGYHEIRDGIIEKIPNERMISNDFYRTQSDNPQLSITISAIVGKNGDGKSSIVELIIRILNNFSFAVGFQKNHADLKPMYRLYARLFYSINNNICSITVLNNEIIWQGSGLTKKWDLSNPKNDYEDLDEIKDFLFYTQVSNYSIYAYNSEEFRQENGNSKTSWIEGVFHKNDGYQTPIVLNPFRDKGCIDINKERNLMKDRLISLFISSEEFRSINQKQTAKSLKIQLSKYSKLEKKILYDFFEEEYKKMKENDTSAFPHILNLIKEINDKQLRFFSIAEDIKKIINPLSRLEELLYGDNNKLFIRCLEIKKKFRVEKRIKVKTDLAIFLSNITKLTKVVKEEIDLKKNDDSELNEIYVKLNYLQDKLNKSFSIQKLFIGIFTISEFQRVLQIAYYLDCWNKYLDNTNIYTSIKKNSEIYSLIVDYLVYKSISIIEKYPTYKEYNKTDSAYIFIRTGEISEDVKKAHLLGLEKLWEDLEYSQSHITLKIRQVLKFITNNPFGKDDRFFNKKGVSIDLSKYYRVVEKNISKTNIMEFLPPPIFEIDVILEQKNSKESSLLSDLSSGEKQLLNVISSIVYHIQNISSVERGRLESIAYNNVCLILEEIELYFHPEFQRTFVKLLLDNIYKAQIKNIQGIHICFLTHSPFILSDILNNNILYLKEGKSDIIENDTFGANIHDLLANDFFMNNGFMGEFSKIKIQSIINYLIDQNNNSMNWNRNTAEEVIQFIGEPLIKQSLVDLYYDTFALTEVEKLQSKIEKLQNQLNKKNK